MGYIAMQHMRVGSRTIAPGEPIPVEHGRDYQSMVARGTAIWTPDETNADDVQSILDDLRGLAVERGASDDDLAWLNELCEAALAQESAEEPAEDDAEAEAGVEQTEEPEQHGELESLSRAELNELAAEKGIDNPDKLPNKGEVIAAIASAEEPAEDDETANAE